MRRNGWTQTDAAQRALIALLCLITLRTLAATATAQQQPAASHAATETMAPETTEPAATEAAAETKPKVPQLPPEVQVVRFSGPDGIKVEVMAPASEPVPQGDGGGIATVGLKVGSAYRLRITNIPERPGRELFPLVEIVGHLHRPSTIDPGRYPIRITWTLEDLFEALDQGRLVTQVVYLEDPEFAIPMSVSKEEIPRHTITPYEDPLKVAAGLGRVVAIVRLGGRMPSVEEIQSENGSGFVQLAAGHCSYTTEGRVGTCGLPCGALAACPPAPPRPMLPHDEYLCDGGDHKTEAGFTMNRTATGVDPRDAVIGFIEPKGARVLPTNTVCIYAPRFAMVRNSIGANENIRIDFLQGAEILQRQDQARYRVPPQKLTQHQAAEANRHRVRASGAIGKVRTTQTAQIRILQGYDIITQISGHETIQKEAVASNRQKVGGVEIKQRVIAIKTVESAVLTGIVESANDTVMSWKPQEIAGVELPPKRPGMGVFKHVSASEAEPGDVITFTIYYRNLGNTVIRAVSVVDSLLPRLEYVDGSAQGPKGTVFTATANSAGSSELRWDLPTSLEPGAEGYVSFKAKIR